MLEGKHTRSRISRRDSIAEIRYLEQRLEDNPNSPLSIRLASHYLKTGRTSEAKVLCERAILLYPDYPTAHLVLGKCLLALDRYADAKNAFRRVLTMLPGCLPAQLFLKELAPLAPDELDRPTPIVEPSGSRRGEEKHATAATDRSAGVAEKPVEGSDLETHEGAPSTESPICPEGLIGRASRTGFTDLEVLTEKLKHVKRMAPDPNADADAQPNVDERSQDADIVSETMAEIYASQWAYDEAIRIYRLLIEKKTHHGEKFAARIRELQEKK
ncbi:MAG: tetratricopeptide repeat protein [Bacteroidota bacterium]